MKNIICISLILAFSAGGCITGSSSYRPGYDFSAVDKVAIVSIEGAITSETAKDQIADFFAQELIENGYSPIAREQIRATLASEQVAGNIPSAQVATELGKLVNVPAVIVINIPNFDDTLTMTAKMIDVSDGSIIWMGSDSVKSGRSILNPFGSDSSEGLDNGLMFDFTNFAYDNAEAVPQDLPLTPEEAKRIERIVSNICRSLPIKISSEW